MCFVSRSRSRVCRSRPLSIGIGKALGQRNAPSLFNVALGQLFFWDGRASSLEAQVRFPIENPRELGSNLTEVVSRLKTDPAYVSAFGRTFPDGVTAANVARSIADFERTLLLGNSRVDQFRSGKADALTDAQRQGLWCTKAGGVAGGVIRERTSPTNVSTTPGLAAGERIPMWAPCRSAGTRPTGDDSRHRHCVVLDGRHRTCMTAA
ncbi:MAG: hypothetical protein CM1200mP2_23030 [Planctomycetaceae bacterium]|nr:MAG: hypothetical protein CM1200mP2_23030 [Planctomycetaceae bacterium]